MKDCLNSASPNTVEQLITLRFWKLTYQMLHKVLADMVKRVCA